MSVWYVAALGAELGTMACFAGAIPLYFRKGTAASAGKRVMIACIGVCGASQAAIFFTAGDVAERWRAAGLALFALAHTLFWSAVITHGGNRPRVAFATDAPNRLVLGGPYRWVRHPFYLSYTVAWLAGVVVTASPWLIPTPIVMFLVYRRAAIAEEAGFLCSNLAGQYREYQRQTGMFIPKLCTTSSTSSQSKLSSPPGTKYSAGSRK